jgi:transposase
VRDYCDGKTKQVFTGGLSTGRADGGRTREEYSSQWAAIESISQKIGCTGETLRRWVVQAQRDAGHRPGLTTSDRERLKQLERENRELKRANEVLRKASAFFAQAELDRKPK